MRISDWSSDVCSSDLKRKEEAGDIGRYGIARQAQHQRVAQPARHQRLAGLQRHLDEIERGPARQKCRLYKIMVAHRSAANCKDDVMASGSIDRALDRVQIVADDAHVVDIAAR